MQGSDRPATAAALTSLLQQILRHDATIRFELLHYLLVQPDIRRIFEMIVPGIFTGLSSRV
jgi:hypothetical protein